MIFRYEQLTVTKDILDLINNVYDRTLTFPSDEKYGLTSQVRRSVNSILMNLAEGSARNSRKDFARFITIALGSLAETHASLSIAINRTYVSKTELNNTFALIEKVWFKLCALRKSQIG